MDTKLRSKTQEILRKLDLNPNQVRFYVALLELGETSLSAIMKKARLTKPTTYRVLEELDEMGLIVKDAKKYSRSIVAVSPKRLLALASNRQRKMRRLELEIQDVLPDLTKLLQHHDTGPHVEVYDDDAGYMYLANMSLEAEEKMIYYMGNVEDFYHVFGEEYDEKYYIPTRIERGIALHWLLPENDYTRSIQARDSELNRETRFLPKDHEVSASMLVFDTTVSFFSSYKEKIAISVTSRYLAQMQKAVFEMIWNMVK